MAKIGLEGKAYRNSAAYETPTWVEMDCVSNVTINLDKGTADLSKRGGNGWRQKVGTLKDKSIDFEMIWDSSDANQTAIMDNYLSASHAVIDLAFMDGDITTVGNEGARAEFIVTNISRTEGLEDGMVLQVTVEPGASDNAPTWMRISA